MSLFDLPALLSAREGRLLLASGSPRRSELLREAGFVPIVVPQDVDETPQPDETPKALVERLARLKATSALDDARNGDVVVAADTTVAIGNEDLGKPASDEDARRMLRMLSGATHHVSTGVCLAVAGSTPSTRQAISFVETTEVTFYDLTEPDIDAYVATGEPADKAGAYGIQGLGRALESGIEGDYYNVVGLPVARVLRELSGLLAKERE